MGAGIATGLWTGWCGDQILLVKRFSTSPICLYWPWGPDSLVFIGYHGSFTRVEWPGHEVNHSSQPSANVKNEWSCTFTPVCLHGTDRENLTFNFYTSLEGRTSMQYLYCITCYQYWSNLLVPCVVTTGLHVCHITII
jgi:hypothetical protein